jgi:hypothetical protein
VWEARKQGFAMQNGNDHGEKPIWRPYNFDQHPVWRPFEVESSFPLPLPAEDRVRVPALPVSEEEHKRMWEVYSQEVARHSKAPVKRTAEILQRNIRTVRRKLRLGPSPQTQAWNAVVPPTVSQQDKLSRKIPRPSVSKSEKKRVIDLYIEKKKRNPTTADAVIHSQIGQSISACGATVRRIVRQGVITPKKRGGKRRRPERSPQEARPQKVAVSKDKQAAILSRQSACPTEKSAAS